MLAWIGQFLMKDFQAFLSLAMTLLTFLSFRSLLITLFHVFLGHSLGKLPITLKFLHLLDETHSSILSRWPNHCSLLSFSHSLMLFNFSLVLSSSAEILSSDRALLIQVIILASFPHIFLFNWPNHTEYNLPFAPKGKLPLANKGTKPLNLHHPHLILVITMPTVPPLAACYRVTKIAKFSTMSGQSSGMYVCWFALTWYSNLLSSLSLPLKPLHLLCNQHLQNWHRMKLLPTPFLQTAQGNLPSIVTFTAFLLRIIILVFLTFTLNHFDSSTLFQVSSFPFRPSSVLLNNVTLSA